MGDAADPAPADSLERRARTACRERFGPPAAVASAPGRVNLVGGHTDYNEGFVLPAAIDRRTAVAARPRVDDRLRVHSATVGETATVAPDDGPRGEWSDYPAGVVRALRAAGHPVDGADLAVVSDVPPGAGLSSSAALEVATGAALCALSGVDLAGEELATLCRRAENEFVGVPCGVLDQFAAVFGCRDRALALDCRSLDYDRVPLPAERVRLVAVDTTVAHDLAETAYGERRRSCERGVARLAALLDREVDALRDVSPAAFDRVAADLPPTVRKRCRHVIEENERVRTATAALRAGDLDRVGACLEGSHGSLREEYEVSCAELDAVVEIAHDAAGVYGARMTGGGFGGSAVALVDRGAVDRFVARVERDYPERTGIGPEIYVCGAAAGCRLGTERD